MDRDDWYEDRILWRASQHSLVGDECSIFSELPRGQQESLLEETTVSGRPVLLFGGPDKPWTLLTTRCVASHFASRVQSCDLDQITNVVAVPGSGDDIKHSANIARLTCADGEVDIWAPPGPVLFALVGILRMFPMAAPQA